MPPERQIKPKKIPRMDEPLPLALQSAARFPLSKPADGSLTPCLLFSLLAEIQTPKHTQ
jgi:hypothetical protein